MGTIEKMMEYVESPQQNSIRHCIVAEISCTHVHPEISGSVNENKRDRYPTFLTIPDVTMD